MNTTYIIILLYYIPAGIILAFLTIKLYRNQKHNIHYII